MCLGLPGHVEVGDRALECLRGHADGFGECRVRMDRQADILGIGAEFDGQRCLSDEVASGGPDNPAADDALSGFVEQDLGQALVAAKRQRTPGGSPRETPLPYLTPAALASFSVVPTHATSGSV